MCEDASKLWSEKVAEIEKKQIEDNKGMSEADIIKNNLSGDFRLMQTLPNMHKGSVRCVTVLPQTDMIISGSMDKATNVYMKDEAG